MHGSFLPRCSLVAALGGGVLTSLPALAEPADARAAEEANRAMEELFPSREFAEAKKVLERAILDCKACSNRIRARLYRDLGVVYVTGFDDTEDAVKAFKKSISIDTSIELDPVFTTAAVGTAFERARTEYEVTHGQLEEPDEAPTAASSGGEADEDDACSDNADCLASEVCEDGACAPSAREKTEEEKKEDSPGLWIAFGLIQDAGVASGDQVCTPDSQLNDGYTCLRSTGSQYHGQPVAGGAGTISGVGLASTRVTLAPHLRLFGPISIGLRLGYVVAGAGPRPDGGEKFLRYHAEAIAAYWLSGKALSTERIGTFLQFSGGMAQVDTKKTATVRTNLAVDPPPHQLDNPEVQDLDVYQKAGTGFVSAGAGLFLPVGQSFGLLSDLRVSAFVPTSGWAISLGVSAALGL